MNEKLTEKVMLWVSTTAEQIGDFAAKEIPPFITEYLTWKFWENVLHIGLYGFAAVVFGLLLFGAYKVVRWIWVRNFGGDDFVSYLSTIALIIVTIVYSVNLCINFPTQNLLDCVKIKIAPKVYLIEKAAELLKK